MRVAIDPEKLRAALERLGDDIANDVACVNHGGCGVVAAEVGKQLTRLGIECDIATGGYPECLPAALVRDEVMDHSDPLAWDAAGLGRGHLAVRFRLGDEFYTWDTNGFAPDSADVLGGSDWCKNGEYGTGLTVAEADAMNRKQRGWNRTFDRRQIPTIRKLVRDTFTNLRKEAQ